MKQRNKTAIIIPAIFAIVGLIFAIIGIVCLISGQQFKKTAIKIDGIITEIDTYRDSDGDTRHRTYVTYDYDGTQYDNISLGSYSSGMYEGQTLELLCDPNNPGRVRTTGSNYLLFGIFFGMGLTFMLIGGIPILISIRKRSKHKKLLQTGRVLSAVIEDMQENTNYSVNGRHPYIIYCTYTDEFTGITYRFKSDNLWHNPGGIFTPTHCNIVDWNSLVSLELSFKKCPFVNAIPLRNFLSLVQYSIH